MTGRKIKLKNKPKKKMYMVERREPDLSNICTGMYISATFVLNADFDSSVSKMNVVAHVSSFAKKLAKKK